ncbi:MAPEG family protein [Kaarinaea lacus]
MQQTWILYPMFVMVLLSMLVGLRMLQLRYRAVLQDNLTPAYFAHNRGGKPPAYMMQAEQHYANLYETPVLFYAVVILIYILNMTDPFSLTIAWTYIASRLIHTYVHLGQNRLAIRRNIFLSSVTILAVLWSYVLVNLLIR